MSLAESARLLEQYAKQYHAGAFATPLRRELEVAAQAGRLHTWRAHGLVVGFEVYAQKTMRRRDFTGATYELPAGTRLLTHLATEEGAELPDLRAFDAIFAYAEDHAMTTQLRCQGFRVHAVRISAASEILALYRRGPARPYAAYDTATLTELPLAVDPAQRQAIACEVTAISGWRDDFPYYHKGEWGQAILRGYKPDDPFYGVKPPEMSKAWKTAHPDDALLTSCDWTVLAARLPATLALVRAVPWWRAFERVRLLRLQTGRLVRHTDITDRDAGTADGHISRFHIPLVTHPDVRTQAWGLDGLPLVAHWQAWHLYYLDQRKPHAVTNPSPVERIHLVVDVISDAGVRQRIAASAA